MSSRSAPKFDMSGLLSGDRSHMATERLQSALVVVVEALEEIFVQRRHLTKLAAKQFLQRCCGTRVGLRGLGQLDLQPVDSKKHENLRHGTQVLDGLPANLPDGH